MTIQEDVIAMVELLQQDQRMGPYVLYANPRVLGFTGDRRIARKWSKQRGTRIVTYNFKPRLYEVPLP